MSKGADVPSTTAAVEPREAREARAPDAVYLDPPAALPEPMNSSRATDRPRDPVVTLREPVDVDRVRAVTAQFFDALARDDDAALVVLLTSDAIALDSRAAKTPLLRQLRQRLRQHDFTRLAGLEAARPRDIVTYERQPAASPAAGAGDDSPSNGAAGAGGNAAKSDPHDADVAVRVPMENPRPAGEPLFPDTIYLLVRDEHGALRISGEGEDVVP